MHRCFKLTEEYFSNEIILCDCFEKHCSRGTTKNKFTLGVNLETPVAVIVLSSLYLDKDFLEQRSAVGQRHLWLGVALNWSLLLIGRWLRRLRGGAYGSLGHVGQVKEQVEAFDQRGGNGHRCHAVHSFLVRNRQKQKV